MLQKVKLLSMNIKPRLLSHSKECFWQCFGVAFAIFFMLGVPQTRADEFIIVVHPDNPSVSLGLNELTQIYLGRKTFFESGDRIVPLDLANYKAAFYEGMLNKNLRLINQYWTKVIFSGRGTPPMEFTTSEKVIAFLKENPGGLAYLPAGVKIEFLKELKILP